MFTVDSEQTPTAKGNYKGKYACLIYNELCEIGRIYEVFYTDSPFTEAQCEVLSKIASLIFSEGSSYGANQLKKNIVSLLKPE